MPLQLRRGTEAERQAMTHPLQEGEPLFITDDNLLYIGTRNQDGSMPLPRDLESTNDYTDEHARDAICNMFIDGAHPNINFNVNYNNNTISTYLDLSQIAQDIIPNINSAYDLGTDEYRFKDLYLSGDSLWIGDAKISATNSVIDLPIGSTIGGTVIGDNGITDGEHYNIGITGNNGQILIDVEHNILRTSALTLINNVILSNNELLLSSQDAGRYTFTTLPISVTNLYNIVEQSNHSVLNINCAPANAQSTFSPGDITSLLQFKSIDENPEHDTVYGISHIGNQIDPTLGDSTYVPTKFFVGVLADDFLTAPIVDSIRYLTFNSKGFLAVNQETAEATIDINGFMKLAILENEPAPLNNGVIAIADGINWNPTGSGTQTMVVRLNNMWIELASGSVPS